MELTPQILIVVLPLIFLGGFVDSVAGGGGLITLPACLMAGNNWAYIDTGIVSQNISLFASAFGLATVPQGSMPREQIIKDLKLTDKQLLILNHPVGYPAEQNK